MRFMDFLKKMFKVEGHAGVYKDAKDRPLEDPKNLDMN